MTYGKQETTERSLHRNLFFNPVRPLGLGQMKIGTAGDFASSVGGGWRRLKVTHNTADRSTTFNYHGEIRLPGRSNRCGDCKASKKVDGTQKLIVFWVSYGTPVEQTFPCPEIGFVTRETSSMFARNSEITRPAISRPSLQPGGDHYKFVTSVQGIVTW